MGGQISKEEQLIKYIKSCDNIDEDLDILSLDISQIEVNYRNKHNRTLLYIAVNKRRHNIVKLLLENGADPDLKCTKKSETCLISAVGKHDYEMVEILLEHEADPNIKCNIERYDTPLIFAVRQSRYSIAKLLLENGADPNIKYANYKTALSRVNAEFSLTNIEMIKLLLKHGADPNVEDDQDIILLSYAMIFNDIEIIELLLENGADPNFVGNGYRSPILTCWMYINVGFSNINIFKLLVENSLNFSIISDKKRMFTTRTTDSHGIKHEFKIIVNPNDKIYDVILNNKPDDDEEDKLIIYHELLDIMDNHEIEE